MGSEMCIRDSAEAEAFGQIRNQTRIPLVADIHFDHKIALRVADLGVDCLRINPGNISREERLREVISKAKDLNIPIRIGVNAGSLGRDLLRSTESLMQKRLLSLRCEMLTGLINMIFRILKLA